MYFIFAVPYVLITRRTVYVRRALIFAVYAVLILLYTLGRFSAVSDESSLKVAELLAHRQWSKLKLY